MNGNRSARIFFLNRPASKKELAIIGFEIPGLFGLPILAAHVWAIINVFPSDVSIGKKVAWIVGVVAFPVVAFLFSLLTGPREKGQAIECYD